MRYKHIRFWNYERLKECTDLSAVDLCSIVDALIELSRHIQ
ncbi:hypothetical protein [Anaerocolumna sp.]|nr:hypothetical protein [Anaerocolumna sp.]